jgi:hypothetical protein
MNYPTYDKKRRAIEQRRALIKERLSAYIEPGTELALKTGGGQHFGSAGWATRHNRHPGVEMLSRVPRHDQFIHWDDTIFRICEGGWILHEESSCMDDDYDNLVVYWASPADKAQLEAEDKRLQEELLDLEARWTGQQEADRAREALAKVEADHTEALRVHAIREAAILKFKADLAARVQR